jgi:hypothetical protein
MWLFSWSVHRDLARGVNVEELGLRVLGRDGG